MNGVGRLAGKPLPEAHLPAFGRVAAGHPAFLPERQEIGPHDLILVEEICQLPGQLETLEFRVLALKIVGKRGEGRFVEVAQQALETPDQHLPTEAVGVDRHPQAIGQDFEEGKRQQVLEIAPDSEILGHSLGDDPLQALALDEKHFSGEGVDPLIGPDDLGQVPQQVFGSVGGVEIEHRTISRDI
jgi:hypothetical protein